MAPKTRYSFTESEDRRRNIEDHIRLLEDRYPESVRQQMVDLLEKRLRRYQAGGGDD